MNIFFKKKDQGVGGGVHYRELQPIKMQSCEGQAQPTSSTQLLDGRL